MGFGQLKAQLVAWTDHHLIIVKESILTTTPLLLLDCCLINLIVILLSSKDLNINMWHLHSVFSLTWSYFNCLPCWSILVVFADSVFFKKKLTMPNYLILIDYPLNLDGHITVSRLCRTSVFQKSWQWLISCFPSLTKHCLQAAASHMNRDWSCNNLNWTKCPLWPIMHSWQRKLHL